MSVPDWLWLLNSTDIRLSDGFTSCSAEHNSTCRDSTATHKKRAIIYLDVRLFKCITIAGMDISHIMTEV